MQVAELWRYPVKSMQGEQLDECEMTALGVSGDRRLGVLDCDTGRVVSAKRDGRLLEATAVLRDSGVAVTLPGESAREPGPELDARLTDWLGRASRLVTADDKAATFESPEDVDDDDSPLVAWTGRAGFFVDSSPLHLLSTVDLESLGVERPDLQWDVRRFRPNVVLSGGVSGELERLAPGTMITLGSAELSVTKGCERCVMTTRAQPAGLERQPDVLRHVLREHGSCLGLLATVVRDGSARVGDAVQLSEPQGRATS